MNIPYGHKKDPDRPKDWLADEAAAMVVMYIFISNDLIGFIPLNELTKVETV